MECEHKDCNERGILLKSAGIYLCRFHMKETWQRMEHWRRWKNDYKKNHGKMKKRKSWFADHSQTPFGWLRLKFRLGQFGR